MTPVNPVHTCARCNRPVTVAASGNLVAFPGVTTCGSTALLHTTDKAVAAVTSHEFV